MSEVKLPKAIREEAERADQIERELAAMVNDQITDAVTQTPPIDVPPIDLSAESPPSDTPSEETPPVDEPPPEDPNSETWQSRYNALQGKYNAEVPRLHQQLRELTQYVQQVEAKVNTPSDPIVPTDRLNEKDREAAELFGEDLVNYIRERSQAEAERRIAELKQSQQHVEQRIAQSEHERFFAQVEAAVPNWRDIDKDPAWLGWLEEYDPMLGAPRQAAVNEAVKARDSARAIHLFNAFLGTRRPASASAPAQPSRALQEQVTPRPAGNASVASAPQVRIYTQADIAKLLDPRHFNRLPREQQIALERDIDLAYEEGRIAA